RTDRTAAGVENRRRATDRVAEQDRRVELQPIERRNQQVRVPGGAYRLCVGARIAMSRPLNAHQLEPVLEARREVVEIAAIMSDGGETDDRRATSCSMDRERHAVGIDPCCAPRYRRRRSDS